MKTLKDIVSEIREAFPSNKVIGEWADRIEALASEPVAWANQESVLAIKVVGEGSLFVTAQESKDDCNEMPLYAAPQPAASGEVEALERDAARYRWLRMEVHHGFWQAGEVEILDSFGSSQFSDIGDCVLLDAAIDRALLARREA